MPFFEFQKEAGRNRTRSPSKTSSSGSEDEDPDLIHTPSYWNWNFSPFDKTGHQHPVGVRIHVLLSKDGIANLLCATVIPIIDESIQSGPSEPGFENEIHGFQTKTFSNDCVNTKELLSGKYHVVGSHALNIVAGWDDEVQESRRWMPVTLRTRNYMSGEEEFWYCVIPVSGPEQIVG